MDSSIIDITVAKIQAVKSTIDMEPVINKDVALMIASGIHQSYLDAGYTPPSQSVVATTENSL